MNVLSYAPSTPEDRIRRRRALFSDYNKRREREAAQTAPEPAPVVAPVTKPRKGVCDVCGEYIGRGVGLHRKRCEG